MYCPKCGKENTDSSQFCISCGTKIEEPEQKKTDYPKSEPKVNEIDQIRDKYNDSVKMIREILKRELKIKKYQEKIENRKSYSCLFWLISFGVCWGLVMIPLIVICIFFADHFGVSFDFFTYKIFVASAVIGAVLWWYLMGGYRIRLRHKINKLENEIEMIRSSSYLNWLPLSYRTPLAFSYIQECLEYNRVSNMQELLDYLDRYRV